MNGKRRGQEDQEGEGKFWDGCAVLPALLPHFFPPVLSVPPRAGAGPGQSSSQAKGVSWPLFPNRVSGAGATVQYKGGGDIRLEI